MTATAAPAPARRRFACRALLLPAAAFADGEVNLYTTREPGLVQPLIDAFTKETGITVNTVFVKDGLPERVAAEGENSPADVLMTVDFGGLVDLVDKGVTQPIESDVLDAAVPENLRDPERPLVRAVDARPRPLRRQGSRPTSTPSPTSSSPTRSGRARSASAPASTPTTSR